MGSFNSGSARIKIDFGAGYTATVIAFQMSHTLQGQATVTLYGSNANIPLNNDNDGVWTELGNGAAGASDDNIVPVPVTMNMAAYRYYMIKTQDFKSSTYIANVQLFGTKHTP
jgi:hypothetical protein